VSKESNLPSPYIFSVRERKVAEDALTDTGNLHMFGTLLTIGWYMWASYALCNSVYNIAARKCIQTETEELQCPRFVFVCDCNKG
jgi:hypothetical protein